MPTIKKNFNAFQEDTNISLTDKLVGFASNTYGGERKWSFQSLINNINTKSPSSVKAWVQYGIKDQKWSIKSSFNVASVTKGTHTTASWNNYVSRINFIDPMPSNDYAVVASYNMTLDNDELNKNYWHNLWPINAAPWDKQHCRLFHYSAYDYRGWDFTISAVIVSK